VAVYLVRGGDLVKIGFTAGCVAERMVYLQVGSPVNLTLLRVIVGDESAERALHKRFAHLRSHGEWFTFSDELLGDLGGADLPLPKKKSRIGSRAPWSDEARAKCSERQKASFADPIKGPLRRAKTAAGRKRNVELRRARRAAEAAARTTPAAA
jgi:hypothetical protein